MTTGGSSLRCHHGHEFCTIGENGRIEKERSMMSFWRGGLFFVVVWGLFIVGGRWWVSMDNWCEIGRIFTTYVQQAHAHIIWFIHELSVATPTHIIPSIRFYASYTKSQSSHFSFTFILSIRDLFSIIRTEIWLVWKFCCCCCIQAWDIDIIIRLRIWKSNYAYHVGCML